MASFSNPLLASKSRAKALRRQAEHNRLMAEIEVQARYDKEFAEGIPLEPQLFYQEMGYIEHPRTGKPVLKLTSYQRMVWKLMQQHKYCMIIKSQKIGLTTAVLMADFQFSILPSSHPLSCRGHEILVIAQSIPHAREHLYTLRKMILQSKKYSHFLIDKPTELLMRDEVTKVTTLYIKNPDNPYKPTRIIGLGAKEGAVWSWKEVKFIHVSDIAASEYDYTGTINAALTRLANTGGRMVIESPPRGPQGKLYEIYTKSREQTDLESPEGQFKIKQIPVDYAVAEGVITEEQVDEYRALFGREFPQYFEAEFIAVGGNVLTLEDIERAEKIGKTVDYTKNVRKAPKSMGIDPGFGSSKFGIVITQMWNGRVEVIYSQEFGESAPTRMLQQAWELAFRYGVNKIYIDSSNPGYIRDIKRMFAEREDYEVDMKRARRYGIPPDRLMKVVPKSFATHGREMLADMQAFFERGLIAVHPDFEMLLRQCRSALEINGQIDKSKGSFDSLDALRLSLQYFSLEEPDATLPPRR